MIGTRNIIVHGYDQVKLQIVWKILQRDLENLKFEIVKVLGGNRSMLPVYRNSHDKWELFYFFV